MSRRSTCQRCVSEGFHTAEIGQGTGRSPMVALSRIAAVVACITLAAACQSTTQPIDAFVGSYSLQTYNAQSLPLQLSLPSGCTRTVSSGSLHLTPKSADTQPIYSWDVRATDTCSGSAPNSVFVARDHGIWRVNDTAIVLESSEGGSYRAQIESGSSPITTTLRFGDNTYRFTFVSSSPL